MNESVSTLRRTKIVRWCDWCHRSIAVGEQYKRVVVFGNRYEGYVRTFSYPLHIGCA